MSFQTARLLRRACYLPTLLAALVSTRSALASECNTNGIDDAQELAITTETSWIQRSPAFVPLARFLVPMVYDSARGRIVSATEAE